MVVIGRNTQIASDIGRIEEVSPFTPDHESICQIFEVDTVIRHDDECTIESCSLIVIDALSTHAMDHDPILQFLMRDT